MTKHIIISPHLDDAVLSCGELIKHFISVGDNVLTVTVFTAFPPSDDLSDAAKQYHSNCFLGDNSMIFRQAEDLKAMEYLGCKYKHLHYYECLYRKNISGIHIYPDLKDIYHLDFANEVDIFYMLCAEMKEVCKDGSNIYVPFGLGNHADHLLIRKVFDAIRNELNGEVFFYEEIPYICYYYKDGGDPNFEKKLKPNIFRFTNLEWEAKMKAFQFYKSQLHIMWRIKEEIQVQLENISKKYDDQHSIRLWR
jgi:LmbE family N-acetylglucosaminyl deacetylase